METRHILQNRSGGLTGLRQVSLLHHPTCGFPHPAVEPSSATELQDRMEEDSHNAEACGWRDRSSQWKFEP